MNSITTTSTDYQEIPTDVLLENIKKANSKALSKGREMVNHMKLAGHMLIEMKRRSPHGSFMINAECGTGLKQRTINRYMEMARGTTPHRTIGNRERETRNDKTLNIIRATEFIIGDDDPKMDTMSTLAPAAIPRAAAAAVIDVAEIVEPLTEKESSRLAEPEAIIENGIKNIPNDLDDEPEAIVVDGTKLDSALKGTLALFAKKENPEPSPYAIARNFIATLKNLTAWQERQTICDVRDACNRRLEELDKLKGKEKP